MTREQEIELDAYTLLASAKAVAQDGLTEGTMPFVKETAEILNGMLKNGTVETRA